MNDRTRNKNRMDRRQFMGTLGSAAAGSALGLSVPATGKPGVGRQAGAAAAAKTAPYRKVAIRPFDYQGVVLRPSRWQRQYQSARDFYMGLPSDDVLKGFRLAAGLPAPGTTLGGWCERDSYTVFGQWLQAMARAARTGDTEMRGRAADWVSEWAKAWKAVDARGAGARGRPAGLIRHYPYEKLLGGLVDMHHYAGHPEALEMARKITEVAIEGLDRDRVPATRETWELHSGRPLEWYTLGENLYRAYELTGDATYREFAGVWLYHAYWDKFLPTADPANAYGVHAYSHTNSFSSAALAYDVTGDARYLAMMKNFYDFMQRRQTYATGGYGPNERIVPSDGALGDSLEVVSASFECPCCSWAAIKLSKYLMAYTGEARYGDWIERLLYNGIGAALPIKDRGVHFYYADHHLGADLKYYSRNTFTCCSGTYFQNVAEYPNLVYFEDDGGLYVNLYVPSEATWQGPAGPLRVVQTTEYPEADSITLRLAMERPATFALRLRVPGWSRGMSLEVNGTAQAADIQSGKWAALKREWEPGDRVEITIPLHFRRVPIDAGHPDRVALVRGPVVYAQEDVHKWLSVIPRSDEEVDRLMRPLDNEPAVFQIANEPVVGQRDAFLPYYRFGELARHRLYHDPGLRRVLW